MLQRISAGNRRYTIIKVAVVRVCREKGASWNVMENDGKRTYSTQEMLDYYCRERLRVKKFREEAEKERQAVIQGQWQHESPSREYLEQVKCCSDTD